MILDASGALHWLPQTSAGQSIEKLAKQSKRPGTA